MHENVDIEKIIDRLKKKTRLSTNKDIADLLGLSPTDYGNRKKRGTLLPILIDWALNEKVDLQDFIVGRRYISEQNKDGIIDDDPEVAELLEGARRVLKSGNPIAFDALERNIRYFDHAVATEKRLEAVEEKLEKVLDKLAKTNEMKKAANE
jgi:hypothetical protein